MSQPPSSLSYESLLDAALEYAAHGRAGHPVAGDGSKRPLTDHGFKDATTNAFRIRDWWSRWPNAWIGLATGDGWFVLDVDDLDALAELERRYGVLPDTRRVKTPRGGVHFYYYGTARTGNNVPVEGIDIRGYAGVPDRPGGFVVAPPSPGYVLLTPDPVVNAPRWLTGLIEDRERHANSIRKLIEVGELCEGERDSRLTSLAGHLLRKYVDVDVAAELLHAFNQQRCKPPLPPGQVDKIIDSVAGMELRRREAGR